MAMFTSLDHARAWRLLIAALILWAQSAAADTALRTAQVRIGKHPMKVEIVDTDPQREKGLMFREKLGHDDGMLFVFDEPAYHSIWMKNTLIPLSVAFIDRDGIILNIEDMEPRTLDTHTAAGPAAFAIEANKGWYAEKKVRPGDKVTGLPKAR
jgi:hypothetical protein